jgi:adenine-specific DNA glycosylase
MEETSDPYKIWISEIIFQQTRVEQGWAIITRVYRKVSLHLMTLLQQVKTRY